MLLEGKNALLTGAARGIGAAALAALAAEGANVWALARTRGEAFEERCAALAAEHGVRVTPLYADLRDGRRTEVDTISGSVIRASERNGVPAPTHRAMVQLVHAMEQKHQA